MHNDVRASPSGILKNHVLKCKPHVTVYLGVVHTSIVLLLHASKLEATTIQSLGVMQPVVGFNHTQAASIIYVRECLVLRSLIPFLGCVVHPDP